MKTVNNNKSVESNTSKLLQQMELIATSLITTQYITDFTIHDTNFVHRTNAETPFVWLVYYSGTHIYALNDKNEILNFTQTLYYFENNSSLQFCLYRYDGNKLCPVFPTVIKDMIENKLTEYSH